jgi:hypothetical protein
MQLPIFISSLSTHTLVSNYTQLGLAFTLYSAEVLFNKGEQSSNFFFFLF